jgi:hypothetical protein
MPSRGRIYRPAALQFSGRERGQFAATVRPARFVTH